MGAVAWHHRDDPPARTCSLRLRLASACSAATLSPLAAAGRASAPGPLSSAIATAVLRLLLVCVCVGEMGGVQGDRTDKQRARARRGAMVRVDATRGKALKRRS